MKTAAVENTKLAIQGVLGGRAESGESGAFRKIEQSIAYMTRHLDKPLQVSTLAARANVSPSHFFALFKRQTGCAPIDCFIRLRMQRACRLLDETTLSVKEVAATLGYDDPFYFSRVFKSVNRVAPSEYRLLKNGAKATVRDCGITLRLFSLGESRTGLDNGGSPASQDSNHPKVRISVSSAAASERRNGEIKCVSRSL